MWKKIFLFLITGILFLNLATKTEAAVGYFISDPTPAPPLTTGQTVSFTLTIDTGGEVVKSGYSGVTFDTRYLQYANINAGSAFTTVTPTTPAAGQLVLAFENSAGFNGTGTIATVNFTVIAQTPATVQLCSTFVPSITPTETPPPGSTATPTLPPGVTATPIPTCIPVPQGGTNADYPNPPYCPTTPTELPNSGMTVNLGIIGTIILLFAFIGLQFNKKLFRIFLFSTFILSSLFLFHKNVYAEVDDYYTDFKMVITPIPCKGVGGCPSEFLEASPEERNAWQNYPHEKNPALKQECATSIEQFQSDPTRYHYWVEDPKITEQGKADERARQFIYWVLRSTAIDSNKTIRDIWGFTMSIALISVAVVVAIFGIGYIVSQRTSFQLNIELRPTLVKIGMMLLYIAFSYAILLFLIQLSEILMKFFIDNLGGDRLFNIYFAGGSTNDLSYKTFYGCRDLNIRVQEAANAELFMLRLTNVTYYVMGVMILLRKILLWFLIFVSPFLAILMPFILIRNTGWIWIGVFFQWLFYGPLLALFLGATAKIWSTGIPFTFDFSRVKQVAGYVYPTALIITYGGPAQTNARAIGAFNNGNYADTFAEYIISLLMLWSVTFFPWWLLRIFRDYCCEGIYATRNILLAIYDQMRAGPPTKPTGPAPTFPGLKTQIKVPRDTDLKVNVKLGSIEQIRQIQTTEITNNLNLKATRLADVARMEMNKQTQQTVIHNLTLLSNPIKAQTPTERQQYMNLRTELFNRAIKSDSVARTILASTSTSRVEQMKQREEILKQIPVSVPISRIISTQTNLSTEKINTVTQNYINNLNKQETVINNISKSTTLPPEKVQNILSTYSQNMSRPFTEIINTIQNQTNTPPPKIKEVLQIAGSYSTQSHILQETANKEQLQKEHIETILKTLSTITSGGGTVPQIVSSQTLLAEDKTESIISTLFQTVNNTPPVLENIQNITNVSQQQIQKVLTTYSENINNPPADIIHQAAAKATVSPDKVTQIIQSAVTNIQESEVIRDVAQKNNFEVPTVLKVVSNLQTALTSPAGPPPERTLIEKTSQLSNLSPIQVQSIATTVVKNVIQNNQLTQEIGKDTGVQNDQVMNILESYITNISKPASTIINTIAQQNNIATSTVTSVLEKTHDVIEHSSTLRSVARKEQVKTKDVNTVTKVLFTTAKEQAQVTPVAVIAQVTNIPAQQVTQITQATTQSFINSPQLIQQVQQQTGITQENIKEIINSYTANINQNTSSIINEIKNKTQLTKEQITNVLSNISSTVNNSSETLAQISTITKTPVERVKEVTNLVSESMREIESVKQSPLTVLSKAVTIPAESVTEINTSLAQSFVNSTQLVEQVQQQTGVTEQNIKQVVNTFSSNLNQRSDTLVNNIAESTGLTQQQVSQVINTYSNTIANTPQILSTVAQNTNNSQTNVQSVIQSIPSVLKTKDTQSALAVMTQSMAAPAEQVTSIANSLTQYFTSHTEMINQVANQTNSTAEQVTKVINNYSTNLKESSTENLVNNIANTSNVSTQQVQDIINSFSTALNTQTTISDISQQTNINEDTVHSVVQNIPQTVRITTEEQAAKPVVTLVSYKSSIPENKVQSVTNTVINSIVNNSNIVDTIQKQTGLKAPQIQNLLTTYAQNINQPAEVITERINQTSGIQKEKVREVLKVVSDSVSASKEIITNVAQQEGVKEDDVAKVINNQIPLATEPTSHIEQTISIPPNVSIEDYEEVKNMWIKQYEEGEVPVTENVQSRDQWLDQDIVFITNTLNKLLSPDEKLRQEGLDELGFILPVFMINNLKGEELLVYLKAKLEAAKVVQKELEKEKKLRAKITEEQQAKENEEFVELKKPAKEEQPKVMEMEEEENTEETSEPKINEENPYAETNPYDTKIMDTEEQPPVNQDEAMNNQIEVTDDLNDKSGTNLTEPSIDEKKDAKTESSQEASDSKDPLQAIKKKLEKNSK